MNLLIYNLLSHNMEVGHILLAQPSTLTLSILKQNIPAQKVFQ